MHNFYRNILRFIIPSLRRWTDVDKEHNRYFNLPREEREQQHIQQLIHQRILRKSSKGKNASIINWATLVKVSNYQMNTLYFLR